MEKGRNWLTVTPWFTVNFLNSVITRQWSRTTRWAVGLLIVLQFGLGFWLNVYVKPGGILEDPITDPNNALVQENTKASAPFCGSDIVALVLDRQGLSDKAAFSQYREMHYALQKHLPMVLKQDPRSSLVTLPYIHIDKNGVAESEPYLGDSIAPQIAKKHLRCHDMERILYSTDRSRLAILLVLPQGYSQSEVYWGIVEIMEERSFDGWLGWLEKTFWKYDIFPTERYERWQLVGWPLGREAVERALPANTLYACAAGLLLGGIFLFVSVRSWAFVLQSIIFLVLSLVYVRGSIAIFAQFMTFNERPYIIIADANTLVQGLSYFLLVSFIMRAEDSAERMVLVIAGVFNLLMGIMNQWSLWWSFSVRAIEEFAIMSVVGLVDAYVLSQVVLPILQRTIPDKNTREKSGVVSWVQKCMAKLAKHQRAGLSKALLVLVLAGGLLSAPFIPLGSHPLDFIKGHLVWKGFMAMQDDSQPEARRMAADGITMKVSPRPGLDLYDPTFWKDTDGFVSSLESDKGTIAVAGVQRTFFRLNEELHGHRLPINRDEADAVFAEIDLGLDSLQCVRDSLYTPFTVDDNLNIHPAGALQLTILQRETATSEDNIHTMAVIAETAAGFKNIIVERGGTSALYGETDRMVWVGKLWNIATQVGWNEVGFFILAFVLIRLYQQRATRVRVSIFRLSLVMSVPFVFATAAMTIIMALSGVRLDQGNAAILAVANSASSDFTMYFGAFFVMMVLRTNSVERALHETYLLKGDQVIEDVVINMLCFVLLLGSTYLTIREMGWMIPLMLAFCAIGVLVVMPPLLPWTVRRVPRAEWRAKNKKH